MANITIPPITIGDMYYTFKKRTAQRIVVEAIDGAVVPLGTGLPLGTGSVEMGTEVIRLGTGVVVTEAGAVVTEAGAVVTEAGAVVTEAGDVAVVFKVVITGVVGLGFENIEFGIT